jgi:hypothetical protein
MNNGCINIVKIALGANVQNELQWQHGVRNLCTPALPRSSEPLPELLDLLPTLRPCLRCQLICTTTRPLAHISYPWATKSDLINRHSLGMKRFCHTSMRAHRAHTHTHTHTYTRAHTPRYPKWPLPFRVSNCYEFLTSTLRATCRFPSSSCFCVSPKILQYRGL